MSKHGLSHFTSFLQQKELLFIPLVDINVCNHLHDHETFQNVLLIAIEHLARQVYFFNCGATPVSLLKQLESVL